jgi:ANTAR domain
MMRRQADAGITWRTVMRMMQWLIPSGEIFSDKQFRSALASRDIIGQAKGMLMERVRNRRHCGIRVAQATLSGSKHAAS